MAVDQIVAWVNFSGEQSPTLRIIDQLNVDSVDRVGQGLYTINLDSAIDINSICMINAATGLIGSDIFYPWATVELSNTTTAIVNVVTYDPRFSTTPTSPYRVNTPNVYVLFMGK